MNATQPNSSEAPARRPPVLLLVACLVILLQAAALTGLALGFVADLVRGVATVPAATVFLVVFALGVAAVLVLAARGLWRGRRWGRAPVLTWQLFLVVMAVGWIGTGVAWAVAVLVSAVVVTVLLLLPPVLAVTNGRGPAQEVGTGPAKG